MIRYGTEPQGMGEHKIECQEMMFVMYMPVKLAFVDSIKIPWALNVFKPLIVAAMRNEGYFIESDEVFRNKRKQETTFFHDKYVYITAKHLFVTPGYPGNREGWHSDGFGTDDINYIWTNYNPTEFCVQRFHLSDDCERSMDQMAMQAKLANIKTYGANNLLRLTQEQIHRVPESLQSRMRTFVKISISTEQYNLIGNAHNYMFDYNWDMQTRDQQRNHPHKKIVK